MTSKERGGMEREKHACAWKANEWMSGQTLKWDPEDKLGLVWQGDWDKDKKPLELRLSKKNKKGGHEWKSDKTVTGTTYRGWDKQKMKIVEDRPEYLCALWYAADHCPELNLSFDWSPLK